jgi:hypothetical protein
VKHLETINRLRNDVDQAEIEFAMMPFATLFEIRDEIEMLRRRDNDFQLFTLWNLCCASAKGMRIVL